MTDAKVTIEVGGSLRDFASDVAARWKSAAAGEHVEPSRKIVFRDWAALYSTLTPKRMDLLASLHEAPAQGVRALARALDRDVKRVHADVVALEGLGLIARDDAGRISVEADQIQSTINLGRDAKPIAQAS